MARKQRHSVKTVSPVQTIYSGNFAGINGADPTTKVLDNGITLTRSGEGVFVLTLPHPVKDFKSVIVAVNDTGEVHEVSWVTSASARTITITHKTCAHADVATGPAAEDVVANINFIAVVEESDTFGAGL